MTEPAATPPAPIARIVIVSYRSIAVLPRCLKALAVQTRGDFEVVIVNNDPKDRSVSDMPLPDERFSLLDAGGNLGFAAGSNLGAWGAATDWIVTLNPDAFPDPHWFAALMSAGLAYPEAGSLSSAMVLHDDPEVWDGLGDVCSVYGLSWRGAQGLRRTEVLFDDRDAYVLSPCAAAAAYRRDAFEACGGFDPDFFCYVEDMDLGLRLQLRGWKCVLVGKATVRHLSGQSTADDPAGTGPSPLYYSQRNMLRLMIKTFPSWLLPVGLAMSALPQLRFLWRTRGQRTTGERVSGLWAGLRGWRSHWRARKAVQRDRSVSTLDVAKWLAWSPGAVRRKTPRFFGRPGA